jgi:hypothetical protein
LTFRLYDFTKKLFARFSSGLEGGLHDKGADGWIKVHFFEPAFFVVGAGIGSIRFWPGFMGSI